MSFRTAIRHSLSSLSFAFLLLIPSSGYAQLSDETRRIDELLDRPVRVSIVNGYVFLQRDLTDYLNVTLGTTESVSYDFESDVRDEELVRSYFMRPHPSVSALTTYFRNASAEFGVPVSLLMIVGQVESNWTQVGPSIDQGWGVMHLVQNHYCNTLSEAARMIGVPEQMLKDDARQNIRAAAALIAQYAGPERKSFTRLADWLPALAKFSGLGSSELRMKQAETYLSALNDGVKSRTVWDEIVAVAPTDTGYVVQKSRNESSFTLQPAPLAADYGPALTNWATSCNFGIGRNHSIDTWVNHWIAVGTYAGTISWFQTCPGTGPGQRGPGIGPSSAHFVIRNSDGEITQMVSVADTAYHSGATGYPYNNGRSIGVEHEATAANPGMWNSTAMLRASATMAHYFKDQYGFPTTQNSSPGICGHNDMPGTATECPGPLPWATWMSYFSSSGGAVPGNDNCSNATQLTSNTSCNYTSGTVLNATPSGLSKPSCDGASSPHMYDVWYKFTAVASTQVVTVAPATSGGDPVVAAYNSCTGTAIGCADSGGQGGAETLTLNGLSVGSTYYVRVYDYGAVEPTGSDANFQICITGTTVSNYTLTVNGSGTGQGTVTGTGGINCAISAGGTSGTCSATIASGNSVSLNATPTGGATFTGWSGSCVGTGSCNFTMTGNKSVSAAFAAPVTNYTLTVSGSGTGQGTVTGPGGINCSMNAGNTSGACSATIAAGSSVSLSENPTGSSTFGGWGGSCTGTGGCSFTMSSNKNVSASFNTASCVVGTPIISAPLSVFANSTGNAASATASGAQAYNWNVSNGAITTGGSTQSVVFTAGASGQVALTVTATGLGGCTAQSQAAIVITVAPPQLMRDDFDGNQKSDIFWNNPSTGETSIWFMNGGTIASAIRSTTVPTTWSPSLIGDFDADRKADLWWRNASTGETSAWLGWNGSFFGTQLRSLTAPVTWAPAGSGDINGDGRTDILWRNASTGETQIWFMNGAVYSAYANTTTVPTAWMPGPFGDFDGDSNADIFWHNQTTGETSLWLGWNGNAFSTQVRSITVPVGWLPKLAGDINGDGRADLFWYNASTGETSIWFMNGVAVPIMVRATTVPVGWLPATAGDYDGDGRTDLFWHKPTTGETSLWLGWNGTLFATQVRSWTVPTTWAPLMVR